MKDNDCLVNINPDGMDFDELVQFNRDLKQLFDYCGFKEIAMSFRLRGDIKQAIVFENMCDKIYQNLPASVKSW